MRNFFILTSLLLLISSPILTADVSLITVYKSKAELTRNVVSELKSYQQTLKDLSATIKPLYTGTNFIADDQMTLKLDSVLDVTLSHNVDLFNVATVTLNSGLRTLSINVPQGAFSIEMLVKTTRVDKSSTLTEVNYRPVYHSDAFTIVRTYGKDNEAYTNPTITNGIKYSLSSHDCEVAYKALCDGAFKKWLGESSEKILAEITKVWKFDSVMHYSQEATQTTITFQQYFPEKEIFSYLSTKVTLNPEFIVDNTNEGLVYRFDGRPALKGTQPATTYVQSSKVFNNFQVQNGELQVSLARPLADYLFALHHTNKEFEEVFSVPELATVAELEQLLPDIARRFNRSTNTDCRFTIKTATASEKGKLLINGELSVYIPAKTDKTAEVVIFTNKFSLGADKLAFTGSEKAKTMNILLGNYSLNDFSVSDDAGIVNGSMMYKFTNLIVQKFFNNDTVKTLFKTSTKSDVVVPNLQKDPFLVDDAYVFVTSIPVPPKPTPSVSELKFLEK